MRADGGLQPDKHIYDRQARGSAASPRCPAGISRVYSRLNPPAGAFGIMLPLLSILLLSQPEQTSPDSWRDTAGCCLSVLVSSVPGDAPC